MTVTRITHPGNSAKFHVVTKRGEFTLAISFTLRTRIWELPDDASELVAAQELAEAIVSRHDPALPFKTIYIFGEHNTDADLAGTISRIRKYGF